MQKETVSIKNKDDLIKAIQNGLTPKYLFFWGHQGNKDIGKNCLSQWYIAQFELDKVIYPSTEHYMMAEKARLFKDDASLNQILNAKHPGEAKQLGHEIKDFDEQLWQDKRFDIVVKGNLAKFSQNEALGTFLLNTGNRILVEASPVDKIWGIGLTEHEPAAINPHLWPGLNLLGFALMRVRDLRREQAEMGNSCAL